MPAWLMNQARSTNLGVALITLLISELQTFIRQIHIPIEWARRIHQNRLVQIARYPQG
jgi:hypothetical protein